MHYKDRNDFGAMHFHCSLADLDLRRKWKEKHEQGQMRVREWDPVLPNSELKHAKKVGC